jgi:ubiquitin-conjugating enzyme E2 Q
MCPLLSRPYDPLLSSRRCATHLNVSANCPTDVSEYPSSHNYMIFCPDGTPAIVANTLSDISDSTTGKSIIQLLELVSRKLEMIDEDGDRHMLDSQMLSEDDFEGYDDEEDSDDCGYFGDDFKPELALATRSAGDFTNSTKSTPTFRQRIRSDLRKAKKNGFKVGCLGGLLDGHGCYVSLSCRISKLGISEEAMKAWQVEPSEYLVVLFHYPAGYKTMETLISYDNATADRYFGVRIGISSTYKPTMQEAVRAFAILNKEDEKRLDEASQMSSQSQGESPKGFRNSFISRPLNGLLKERFPSLLRYRDTGMPWSGAEDFYNDHIGANIARLDGFQDKYHKPEQINAVYPRIVTADHIQDCPPGEHSLPLVGMQFVLRHFVRCTEFCLICFSKLSEELEAIKPYVCEKPLCLYQYMSLGFGPSIEHEILSQPKVVDLLISFCYASARMGHLKDFPTGLGLMVPRKDASSAEYIKAPQPAYHYHDPAPPPMQATASTFVKPLEMRFNEAAREMIFPDRSEKCPVQKGNWVVIRIATGNAKGEDRVIHCRVAENFYWPTVEVGEPGKLKVSETV